MFSSDLARCVLDSAPDAHGIINGWGEIVFACQQAAIRDELLALVRELDANRGNVA